LRCKSHRTFNEEMVKIKESSHILLTRHADWYVNLTRLELVKNKEASHVILTTSLISLVNIAKLKYFIYIEESNINQHYK